MATPDDCNEIVKLDPIAADSQARVKFIQDSIAGKSCYLADGGQILGYSVLEYSFFEQGFIAMLYIHADWQHIGIGSALMGYLESICTTQKIFTSTNLSNYPMQRLLAKRGYKLSGTIHDLDAGDPELIYVKYLS